MNKVKITVYTGGPDSQAMVFDYTHILTQSSRRFLFYRCEHEPTANDKPAEVLDVAPNHSFALEYL